VGIRLNSPKETKKKLAFRSRLWQTAAIEMAIEWKYRGRIFNLSDIESMRRLIAANPEASRWALSRKLCEDWDWKQPNGALRDMVCRGLMLMLERTGEIELPPVRRRPPGRPAQPEPVIPDDRPVCGRLSELGALTIEQVRRTSQEALFNSLMEQYHYLGYEQPVGPATFCCTSLSI
jgi:hypothetical protein